MKRRSYKDNDIKAPDGFLLGGLRRVRKDGTVLFHRSWWKCPDEWIGQEVWLHVTDGWAVGVEAAPPGFRIYDAQHKRLCISLERTERADAKPVFRNVHNKEYLARMKNLA